MKGPRSLSQILAIAIALAPLTTAWPNWLPDIDALVVRQDDGTTSTLHPQKEDELGLITDSSVAEKPTETATPTDGSEPTTTTADDATTTNTDDATTTTTDDAKTTKGPQTTNLNTGGKSQTGSTNTKSTTSKHKTFDAIDGAGSVAMVTPAVTDASQLYKIEAPTPITWVWNYTSVQADPTAVDVLVSCSTASATWTLTQNMTYEPQATFTWDTWEYQRSHVDNKLVTAEYTLIIYDADTAYTDNAEAGYLAPFSGFRFGLYAAQPYHNLSDWECVTCSAASGDLDRQALGFAVSMSLVTVLSFTWYVVGFAGLL